MTTTDQPSPEPRPADEPRSADEVPASGEVPAADQVRAVDEPRTATAAGGPPHSDGSGPPRDEGAAARRAEREVAAAFVVTIVAALALAVVYASGGQPQWEGALLGIGLFALGYGLVVWARRLLPHREEVQEREQLIDSPEAIADVVAALDEGGVLERRKVLQRLLVGAGAALGLAALFPMRSLGPSPGGALKHTPWTNGLRLVDQQGRPVKVDQVPLDGLVTVFPEGYVGSANGQAVLIRVQPGLLQPKAGREDWAPMGFVAYSKVCSHAGCPVGLYQADPHTLLCPCHQSTFDVLHHARPTFGPAARPLPQLPLRINSQGELEAMGDFSDPIGPSWWTRP